MSDVYTEILVPKKVTAPDIFVKVILILLTGASIAAGVIVRPAFLIAAAVFLLLDILLIPRLSVEYEYLYINGELDVDKIFSKSRRKRAAVYTMEQLELMAPAGSEMCIRDSCVGSVIVIVFMCKASPPAPLRKRGEWGSGDI